MSRSNPKFSKGNRGKGRRWSSNLDQLLMVEGRLRRMVQISLTVYYSYLDSSQAYGNIKLKSVVIKPIFTDLLPWKNTTCNQQTHQKNPQIRCFLNEAIETHHGVRDCANNVFSNSSSCMRSLVTRGGFTKVNEEFNIPNSIVGIPMYQPNQTLWDRWWL